MSGEFEFVDGVTSDISFVACGATLGDLFASAAKALLAATVEDPTAVKTRLRHTVRLEEPDIELLLLRFLNELVYLRDAEGLLLHPEAVRVHIDEVARIEADLAGEEFSPERHHLEPEIKAATAHGLRVVRTTTGGAVAWEASVTLDV